MANAILAQVQGTYLGESRERASSRHINKPQVYATSFVESLVAHHNKDIIDCISEEVLGIDRKLPEATRNIRCGESSSRPRQASLGQRSWQTATTIE